MECPHWRRLRPQSRARSPSSRTTSTRSSCGTADTLSGFTIDLWKNYIKGMEMVNRFHPETEILVLDGIPRNVKQAELMEDLLDVVKIIYLVCGDLGKMIERLKRRALKENRIDDANELDAGHGRKTDLPTGYRATP